MTTRRTVLLALLAAACWVLPNLPFWLTEGWLGFKRAWFNLDYLLAFACFLLGWRWSGMLLGLLAFALDALSAIAQVYLLIDPLQFLQLLRYIEFANVWYYLSGAGVLALVLTLFWLLGGWLRHLGARPLLLAATPLALLNAGALYAYHHAPAGSPLLDERKVVLGSQAELLYRYFYQGILGHAFANAGELDLHLWTQPTASRSAWPDGRALPRKLLLIVMESWGLPLDPSWQAQQIAALRAHPERIRILRQGAVAFSGGTVSGELRELCGVRPKGILVDAGIAGKLATQKQECWPQRLARQGYVTHSLHAASGSMYNRLDWYPAVGLQHRVFMPNFSGRARRCFSFPGLCDVDLVDHVAGLFAGDAPTFIYWLTLNSHLPYDARDIQGDTGCSSLPVGTPASVCRHHLLSREFFDALAGLLLRPEMQGVEVVVVGDHAPPFAEGAARALYDSERVGFLHLGVN